MTQQIKYTIPAMLQESVKQFADKKSLVYVGEENYTYRHLGDDVAKIAGLLKNLGIEKGDKVALLSTNMPNWGKAFFAILWVGATVVPILPDFHTNEIKSIIEHSEAKVMFVSEGLYKSLNDEITGKLDQLILVENFAVIPKSTPAKELLKIKSSLSNSLIQTEPEEVDEEDLASIIYTSGTTGSSKGVMLTHKNLMWTAEKCHTLQDISDMDRFISVLPLSHTFENTLGFLFPIKYGASVHYLRKPPVASVLLPALQKVKPTIMLVVPLIIEKVFKSKILPKFQKSSVTRFLYSLPPMRKVLHRVAAKKLYETFGGELRFFGIGGAKLDVAVERFLYEGKFPYAIGYGLTETSPLLAGAVGKNVRIGSTGIAMEGVQLRLGDADLKTGEGEIQAKGPNVMKGYYKAPEITKEVFTEDGWFKTGDKGWYDKDNFLYIKGRIKNMIVGASGENIYPEEIESVINKMRFVLESLVVEKKGKLVAMVHLNMEEVEQNFKHMKAEAQQYIQEKSDEILKEIHKKVNTQLNKFSRIQQVISHPKPFEKTPTKKIKRFLYWKE
ncbi:MAG TPA: long-chain fatty acid--CoA ligase [Mariniphaga anaerophila]|uniref:Long-chain fatty acid--CoA ligase n=1 Tax=Mariniphaga anaerophila TaxID=1484053 RepID=A0A831LQ73_9BACT|nr:long-chain fatty acid--CoA ligase [Mariniphaga anaerophila]